MNGGLIKSASAVAILAAAGLFSASPAKAADLGGDCCADLEERVAELEATTVRKGNRKVSVTVSGHVGHNIMWWDDGVRSDTYIGDGGNIYSRFRFVGTAKVSPSVTAGFLYEFGINGNAIGGMNQTTGGDDLGGASAPLLRDSTVWLQHKQLGRVKLGHGSTATDNLVLIDLGGMGSAATPDIGLYVGGMFISAGGVYPPTATGNGINWASRILGAGVESWDTARRNHILYQSPTLAGFTLQAAVAEDNFWDVAVRYAGEFGGFRIAAGIGYSEETELNKGTATVNPGVALLQPSTLDGVNCLSSCNEKETQVKGSASILHVPTGLFATFAAGQRDREVANTDGNFWYASGGISQNFFGYGKSVLFGEYSEHEALASVGKVTHWGLGVTQYIDAADMHVFLTYKNFSYDGADILGANDLQTVIGGARINF
ncbi:MAG: porin [Hyphomicrobiaceae bacterium]